MAAEIASAVLRRDRIVVIASLAALTLVAWTYLLLGAGMNGRAMDMGGAMMAMPAQWTPAYLGLVLLMWAVMMLAMMLPSAAPTILLVAAISRRRTGEAALAPATALCFASGYVAVWLGFSLLATIVQWRLDGAGLLSAEMAAAGTGLAGVILICAGVYQWTPLKRRCLHHCRSPLDFLLSHWRDSATGAASCGARHGLFCLGCCWMLMLLLFVGGLMNLLWIAGISLLVLVEKTLPWGGRMSAVAGLVLIAWGLVTLRAVV